MSGSDPLASSLAPRVRKVLRRHVPAALDDGQLLERDLRDDLALDSLGLVVIAVELEEELGVEIRGEEVDWDALRTGRDLVALARRRKADRLG